uniref:Uncharacterized protein n=1 Tax=Trypanosoma congolense (strain IL3000) TaxID=1068625 RepID=G0UN32_TRYCI|nr:conserved hypothetical protein [Trypanosoma congolense IL3000]
MLAMRQLVPSSVAHVVAPLSLVDGSQVILTAIGSSIHIYKATWQEGGTGSISSCELSATGDELCLGSVAAAIVPCAHQCFIVLTQDLYVVVVRYQANLPADPSSWLVGDALHHNNAWIVLHRAPLSTNSLVRCTGTEHDPRFACSDDGLTVQCVMTCGWRYTVTINLLESLRESSELARTKWAFDVPDSMGPQTSTLAPFKRDVLVQSDEELLGRYSVSELAERKHVQQHEKCSVPYGKPPVSVLCVSHMSDNCYLSVAPMTATPSEVSASADICQENYFVFALRDLEGLHFCTSTSVSDSVRTHTFSMPGFSPYLILSLRQRLLVLSHMGSAHVLTVLSINEGARVKACRAIKLAQSTVKPISGVVYQQEHPAGELKRDASDSANTCTLWLLLSNGCLAEVLVDLQEVNCDQVEIQDAPYLVGDCEEGEWPPVCLAGIPEGFSASSMVPFPSDSMEAFEPYSSTSRYMLLSSGVADTYVVDLASRCSVGSLLSNGAMTSACGGPSSDIIVSYAKGVLQRLSPGIMACLHVRSTFRGVQQMFFLSSSAGDALHAGRMQRDPLCFYVLVNTSVNTVVLRVGVAMFEELGKVPYVKLDEPTLALYSAPDAEPLHGTKPLFLLQCTPTHINISGKWTRLSSILSDFDRASHACFGGSGWFAVACNKRFAVVGITGNDTMRIILQETLPSDVSHVTMWLAGESARGGRRGGRWNVAACLWSREVVVWTLGCGTDKRVNIRRQVLSLHAVVLSGFPLTNGNNRNSKARGSRLAGAGLVFVDRRVALLHCCAAGVPFLKALEDVDDRPFLSDACVEIVLHGGGAAAPPHFDFASLRSGSAELVSLDHESSVQEQVALALTSGCGDTCTVGDDSMSSGTLMPKLHCGLVLYLPTPSFYLFLLADSDGITLRSVTELTPPPEPAPLAVSPSVRTNSAATAPICNFHDHSHRHGVLLRGPVRYQVTHSLRLPSVRPYSHSLTKALYLPQSNAIATMVDRGMESSLISIVDVDTFHLIDAISMLDNEVAMCMEPLLPLSEENIGADFVVGTSIVPTSGSDRGDQGDATGAGGDPHAVVGRLLVVQAKPLRIITFANINSSRLNNSGGGAADISVQGFEEGYLVAVAGINAVLVFRLMGDTLSLLCKDNVSTACTTVALQYPFISCGLHSWGTQYMQLSQGRDIGGADNISRVNRASAGLRSIDEDASMPRSLSGTFTLQFSAVEPAYFSSVHSQTVFAGGFARADDYCNVVTSNLVLPQDGTANEAVAALGVVGVGGNLRSSVTRCVRLPACVQRVAVQQNYQCLGFSHGGGNDSEKHRTLCANTSTCRNLHHPELMPWRRRHVPFICWHGRLTALRSVGPPLLLPCADGGLHCAREIPQAFIGPLLRVEQRVAELYDTSFSFSRCTARATAGGILYYGLQRTYHVVSHAAETAFVSPTRALLKQGFISIDVMEELVLLRRLVELPDTGMSPDDLLLASRKMSRLEERLGHVWAEYGGELYEALIAELLYMW